jgi:hypothetical protein
MPMAARPNFIVEYVSLNRPPDHYGWFATVPIPTQLTVGRKRNLPPFLASEAPRNLPFITGRYAVIFQHANDHAGLLDAWLRDGTSRIPGT